MAIRQSGKVTVVSAEGACLIMGEMKEESREDLGHSFIVVGNHHLHGQVAVVNSAEGMSAYITL